MAEMRENEIDQALEPLRELIGSSRPVIFNSYGSINNKFKTEVHVMANFDFDSLKQNITETANAVAGKTAELAKGVAGKAQVAAKKAKLNMELAGERNTLKECYNELGRLYYEKYSGSTDPDFDEAVSNVDAVLERIAATQAAIDTLDAEPEAPEVEAEPVEEPDHIVDEIEQTEEHEADIAAGAAEEEAQEAQRQYEETVDTVGSQQL